MTQQSPSQVLIQKKGKLKFTKKEKLDMQILRAALFIIAQNWKQPRCPAMGDWLNKLWYIHTMEYYSAIKGMNYYYTHKNMDENQRRHAE